MMMRIQKDFGWLELGDGSSMVGFNTDKYIHI